MSETKLTKDYTVKEDMLATHVGSGSVRVLATPVLVALLEAASAELVQGRLSEGEATVGTKVNLDHLNPTPLGAKISVTTELTETEGRLFRFAVSAADETGPIASGVHERFVINMERFSAKAEKRKKA